MVLKFTVHNRKEMFRVAWEAFNGLAIPENYLVEMHMSWRAYSPELMPNPPLADNGRKADELYIEGNAKSCLLGQY